MKLPQQSRWGGLAVVPVLALTALVTNPRLLLSQEVPGTATSEAALRSIIQARDADIEDLRQRLDELERRLDSALTQPLAEAPASLAPPPLAEAPASLAPPPLAEAPASLAPGQFKVDEEAVNRALERSLVQTGALLLSPGAIEVEPSLRYDREETDTVISAGGGGAPAVTEVEIERNRFEAGLQLRLGLPFDTQLELDVPYSYEEVSFVTAAGSANAVDNSRDVMGFGDVAVGLAKGLVQERGWRPNLIARVEWDSDTGEEGGIVPLGSGFHEFTGSLVATKRQDPLVFVAGLSYTKALEDDDIKTGDQIGFSIGTVLAASPETSLRFLLGQTFVDETEFNGSELEGSDQVATSLILGVSSVIGPRMLLDVATQVGLTEDAPDYSIIVSLPIRFNLPFLAQ